MLLKKGSINIINVPKEVATSAVLLSKNKDKADSGEKCVITDIDNFIPNKPITK